MCVCTRWSSYPDGSRQNIGLTRVNTSPVSRWRSCRWVITRVSMCFCSVFLVYKYNLFTRSFSIFFSDTTDAPGFTHHSGSKLALRLNRGFLNGSPPPPTHHFLFFWILSVFLKHFLFPSQTRMTRPPRRQSRRCPSANRARAPQRQNRVRKINLDVHIYIYIYIHIYVSIHLSISISIYLHLAIYIYIPLSLSLSIYIYIYIYTRRARSCGKIWCECSLYILYIDV